MIRLGISRPLSLGAPMSATILVQSRTLIIKYWTGRRFSCPRYSREG
jgi:hypothetical protein